MVLIPSGSFAMGNCNGPVSPRLNARIMAFAKREDQPLVRDNDFYELPVHTVMVSVFYMDKYMVTKAKWDEVYIWATNHSYTFDNAGSGKAPDHPVQTVSWYDCVKWCNARSEKEGLTPCYYTASNLVAATIYRMGTNDIGNECVNWATNGYRLPTEAEWEKAARGGLAGRRFPWGDTISHDQANYESVDWYRCDVSATRGYHPKFALGDRPYTSPVGSFNPNGYGLYDIAGNVFEHCWDWCDATYYVRSSGSNPHGPANGPHGPANGRRRVVRGGSWAYPAFALRSSWRGSVRPDYSDIDTGFRVVCVPSL